jgi:hypothetical protein
MMRDIVLVEIPMRDYFSPEAVSLLRLLLEKNPDHRLGGYKHSDHSPSSPPSS